MTEVREDGTLFYQLIAYLSAWRRLETAVKQTVDADPERYGEIGNGLLNLMHQCYDDAVNDLTEKENSIQHQLEKLRKNAKYKGVKE